jgi:septum formation protein
MHTEMIDPDPDRMATPPRLILASSSPRRRELLALLGLPFEVVPSLYQEPSAPKYAVNLGAFVAELAVNKALEVAGRVENAYVIGADTLVTVDAGAVGVPLGKPVDADDARRMLRLLSGRAHYVFTGVAVIAVNSNHSQFEPFTATVQTEVVFRRLSETMITDYVATNEPLDKAGAYGAQGYAAPFIESFHGDFYNVVGLPICTVGKLLEQMGLEWWRYREQMPTVIG